MLDFIVGLFKGVKLAVPPQTSKKRWKDCFTFEHALCYIDEILTANCYKIECKDISVFILLSARTIGKTIKHAIPILSSIC